MDRLLRPTLCQSLRSDRNETDNCADSNEIPSPHGAFPLGRGPHLPHRYMGVIWERYLCITEKWVGECPLCARNGLMHHSKKRPYSMTSSEIASTLAGMSKPSALAVLRLITSGYLIDCITGKSAGFMPLRIFAA